MLLMAGLVRGPAECRWSSEKAVASTLRTETGTVGDKGRAGREASESRLGFM